MQFKCTLSFPVPPEFVNEVVNRNISVAENANITLSCRATGNPMPKIKWRREDGQPIIVGQEKGNVYMSSFFIIINLTKGK